MPIGNSAILARPVVVLSDQSIGVEARTRLAALFDVRVLPGQYPSEAELMAVCGDSVAILARLATVTRRVIEAAPRLRIIARHGVGVDAVDLAAATERGVVVTTTGSANAAAVAEYTFALLLGLLRPVPAADADMRLGRWSRDPLIGGELDGKTLGIFGLGAIGQRVARQALGFGMRVLAHDPMLRQAPVAGVEMVSRAQLLAESDIVTLHMRLDATTCATIDAQALAAMKSTAILVNTARGELVDEPALLAALQSGRISGAALDTFAEEPLPAGSVLRTLPNVILSPHVAGQTREALIRVGIAAADAIVEELAGRRPANVWNPEAYARRSPS